ncbi:MAG: hypothetical protein KF795_06285 [Labilithrix sp.]|nr:hypothetical protein [Labilithrix sp.]
MRSIAFFALSLFCSIPIAFSLVACGSSDNAASGPAPDPDAGPAEIGESLTILALVQEAPPIDASPLANGTLVFDKPGGERVELPIGADGLVTVTGIDWSLGKAALSIFGPDTEVSSLVELDKAAISQLVSSEPENSASIKRDLTWFTVRSLAGPKLRGGVANAQGEYLTVTATSGASTYQGDPSSYELMLFPNKPASLVLLDWSGPETQTVSARGVEQAFHRWLRLDQPAITEDTTRDLDLATATPLTPTKVKATIKITGGAAGPLGGSSTAYAFVQSRTWNRSLFVGAATKTDVSADGTAFDVDFEFAKLDDVMPLTTYSITLADGASTRLTLGEWPTDGFVAEGMLTPPVVVEATRSRTEPFALEGVPDDADAQILLTRTTAKKKDWIIRVPKGNKSARVPPLDGALSAAVGKPTIGSIASLVDFDGASRSYRRSAASRSFKVK